MMDYIITKTIYQGGWSITDIPLENLVGPGIMINITKQVNIVLMNQKTACIHCIQP